MPAKFINWRNEHSRLAGWKQKTSFGYDMIDASDGWGLDRLILLPAGFLNSEPDAKRHSLRKCVLFSEFLCVSEMEWQTNSKTTRYLGFVKGSHHLGLRNFLMLFVFYLSIQNLCFFFFFRLGVILLRPRSSNPIAAPASRQPATELSTGQVLRLQGVLCGLLSACFFELSSLLLLLLFVCIYIYNIHTCLYVLSFFVCRGLPAPSY